MNIEKEEYFSSKILQDVISQLHDSDYKLLNKAKGISYEGNNKGNVDPEEEPKLYILANNKTKSTIELLVTPDSEVFSATLLLEGNMKYTIDDNAKKGIDAIEEMNRARNFKKQLYMEVGNSDAYDVSNGSKMVYAINLFNKELNIKDMLNTINRMEDAGTFIPTGLDKAFAMSNLNPIKERMFGKSEAGKTRFSLIVEGTGLDILKPEDNKYQGNKLKHGS